MLGKHSIPELYPGPNISACLFETGVWLHSSGHPGTQTVSSSVYDTAYIHSSPLHALIYFILSYFEMEFPYVAQAGLLLGSSDNLASASWAPGPQICHTHQVLTTTGCPLFWLATTFFYLYFSLNWKKKDFIKIVYMCGYVDVCKGQKRAQHLWSCSDPWLWAALSR